MKTKFEDNREPLLSSLVRKMNELNQDDETEAAVRSRSKQILQGLFTQTELMNRALYKSDGWNALMSAYGRFRSLTMPNSNASSAQLRRAITEMMRRISALTPYGINDEASEEFKQGVPVVMNGNAASSVQVNVGGQTKTVNFLG